MEKQDGIRVGDRIQLSPEQIMKKGLCWVVKSLDNTNYWVRVEEILENHVKVSLFDCTARHDRQFRIKFSDILRKAGE